MKKITVLILSLFVFVCVVPVSFAQDATDSASATPEATAAPEVFNFEKAYKDYVFRTDQYNTAHAEYLLARSQYFQAQTLASQTKARDATAAMLAARDEVIRTYLIALSQRLTETQGISESIKNGLTTRLNAEITWWENHKNRIRSAGTLNDLVTDSEEAAKHFPTTESMAYEVLSTVPMGVEFVLRTELNELLSRTKTKVGQIRGNGDLDTTNAERFILETEQKLTRSLDKEVSVQSLITSLTEVGRGTSQQKDKNAIYNQVISGLNESLQYLKDAAGYMKEIVRQIKYK